MADDDARPQIGPDAYLLEDRETQDDLSHDQALPDRVPLAPMSVVQRLRDIAAFVRRPTMYPHQYTWTNQYTWTKPLLTGGLIIVLLELAFSISIVVAIDELIGFLPEYVDDDLSLTEEFFLPSSLPPWLRKSYFAAG